MPRIDAPGLVHHVITRGIEKRRIFIDDADRSHFVWRLGVVLEECSVACLGWALMSNHVHLILRTGPVPVSTAMARLLTGYAVCFNRRHDRVGHLFQNRYRSHLVESEEYLLALIRYVHRNPLRAGLVQDLDELALHPWTGHAVLMGKRSAPFQSDGEILERFGPTPAAARGRLAEWMAVDDPAPAPVDPSSARGDDAIGHLELRVCRELGLDHRRLGSRSRAAASDARAAVVYLGLRALDLSTAEVARLLGISPRSVQRAVPRGARVVATRPGLGELQRSLLRGTGFTTSRSRNVP